MTLWRTGHVLGPDADELRYEDHPEMVGVTGVPTETIDLRPDMPPVHEQIAEDCCAHSVGTLAWWMAREGKITLPFDGEPSVLHLYATARVWGKPLSPLVDEGSVLRFMFDGMVEQGLVSEKNWSEIPENVNVIPPDDLWRQGEACTLSGAHRLSDGADSSRQILAALRRRRPSTLCMRVDERFANIGTDVYDGPGGRAIGSHCMLTVGYLPFLDAFIVRNSWGTSFGDQGYALVSSDVVDRLTYEKYILDVVRFEVAR